MQAHSFLHSGYYEITGVQARMFKLRCLITLQIAVLSLVASTGFAQERPACLTLKTPAAQEDCSTLYGYLEKYVEKDIASDYFFYIDDLVAHSYPELRAADAVHLAQLFEADGHLVAGRVDRDSQRIIVSILIWMSVEQTPMGAGMMEASIKRLHRHAPDTTKRAIAYAASVFGNLPGEIEYSPWGTSVRVAGTYEVNYPANSRQP